MRHWPLMQALMVRLPDWLALGGPQAPHVTVSIAPWASAKLAGGPNGSL